LLIPVSFLFLGPVFMVFPSGPFGDILNVWKFDLDRYFTLNVCQQINDTLVIKITVVTKVINNIFI